MIDVGKLIGQEFGALTVLGEGPRLGQSRYRSLHCRCRCGREADHVLHHVISGKNRDCGCRYDFDKIAQEDIVGKRYGKLLVLAVGPQSADKYETITSSHRRYRTRYRTMICRCDCGAERAIGFRSLVAGTSRSCGC